MTFNLPFPPSALRPNASSPGAWRKKQSAAAAYKALCAIECRLAGIQPINAPTAHLTLRFCPPDNRRRDLDNMLASAKQLIDAVSDAIGVDDYHFGFTILRGPAVKNGSVEVTVMTA